jgi:hypothetical protein
LEQALHKISARSHRFCSIGSKLKAKVANVTNQHGSTVTTCTKGPSMDLPSLFAQRDPSMDPLSPLAQRDPNMSPPPKLKKNPPKKASVPPPPKAKKNPPMKKEKPPPPKLA